MTSPASAASATANATARTNEFRRQVDLEQRRGVGGEPEEGAVPEGQ